MFAGIVYAQLPRSCNTSNVDAHFSAFAYSAFAFAYLKQLFSIISFFEGQTYQYKGMLDIFYSKLNQFLFITLFSNFYN
jgi:hypothetical protein